MVSWMEFIVKIVFSVHNIHKSSINKRLRICYKFSFFIFPLPPSLALYMILNVCAVRMDMDINTMNLWSQSIKITLNFAMSRTFAKRNTKRERERESERERRSGRRAMWTWIVNWRLVCLLNAFCYLAYLHLRWKDNRETIISSCVYHYYKFIDFCSICFLCVHAKICLHTPCNRRKRRKGRRGKFPSIWCMVYYLLEAFSIGSWNLFRQR